MADDDFWDDFQLSPEAAAADAELVARGGFGYESGGGVGVTAADLDTSEFTSGIAGLHELPRASLREAALETAADIGALFGPAPLASAGVTGDAAGAAVRVGVASLATVPEFSEGPWVGQLTAAQVAARAVDPARGTRGAAAAGGDDDDDGGGGDILGLDRKHVVFGGGGGVICQPCGSMLAVTASVNEYRARLERWVPVVVDISNPTAPRPGPWQRAPESFGKVQSVAMLRGRLGDEEDLWMIVVTADAVDFYAVHDNAGGENDRQDASSSDEEDGCGLAIDATTAPFFRLTEADVAKSAEQILGKRPRAALSFRGCALTCDPDGSNGFLYVAAEGHNHVVLIQLDGEVRAVSFLEVRSCPTSVVVSPDRTRVAVKTSAGGGVELAMDRDAPDVCIDRRYARLLSNLHSTNVAYDDRGNLFLASEMGLWLVQSPERFVTPLLRDKVQQVQVDSRANRLIVADSQLLRIGAPAGSRVKSARRR